MRFKRHADDEFFDEVRIEGSDGPLVTITTTPRYKTSDFSGDEWRTSGRIVIHTDESAIENRFANIETCCRALYGMVYERAEIWDWWTTSVDFYRKGHLIYRSTFDGRPLELIHAVGHLPWGWIMAGENSILPADGVDWDSYCFQPGCPEKAVSVYRLFHEYCNRCSEPNPRQWDYHRAFCRRHLRRGDAGFEDGDKNYEVVSGPGPDQAAGWEEDKSPAVFGGIIDLTQAR